MKLTILSPGTIEFPSECAEYIKDAKIYDSSCSKDARVFFIDGKEKLFIKKSAKGTLEKEYIMTEYFNKFSLAPKVIKYISNEFDWLITQKVYGKDATHMIDQPLKLCDLWAETLYALHCTKATNCPVPERTNEYISFAEQNYFAGQFDASLFPDNWGYTSSEDAWHEIQRNKSALKNDTLIHGDYCLPNVIFDNWKFVSHIDLGNAGIGDKHIDLFWGVWTLNFNLKTDKYTDRFLDIYGKNNFNKEFLKLIAACEVFG
jgi:kanamycin kinase